MIPKQSPIQASIGFIIDLLGLKKQNFSEPGYQTEMPFEDVGLLPGIIDNPGNAIDNVPEGGYGIFPLPPTNPGYTPPSFLPGFGIPSTPIDPNDQNQNGIPDDIDALLSGR